MNEALAFDWGTSIVGILDVKANVYMPYRGAERMTEGARRIIASTGTIVSFNGNGRDLFELAKLLGLSSVQSLTLCGCHDDMSEIVSRIRWPPDPGTVPIRGSNLPDTYCYYFGSTSMKPPHELSDDYEISNWADCFMTAELWKRWTRGQLQP